MYISETLIKINNYIIHKLFNKEISKVGESNPDAKLKSYIEKS